MESFQDRIARRMLVVTGKGGVGKTAVTAALGDALARAGRRVLLVEVDPRESLYQMLGTTPSGGEIVRIAGDARQPLRSPGSLSLQNLEPARVIQEMVREHIRPELVARRVLASSVFRHFIESAPGLKELAVLAHAMRALDGQTASGEPPFDTVVLDAPATGHGLLLLTAPRLVADVIHEGPFGRMARQLTAFVADPARLGIVVVTKAEEMPATETIELFSMLDEQVGRVPDLVAVNALYPPLPRILPQAGPEGAFARRWEQRRRINEREIERLRAAWKGPIAELPFLPIGAGRELAALLGQRLDDSLDLAAIAA